jgi:cytidylate kinase
MRAFRNLAPRQAKRRACHANTPVITISRQYASGGSEIGRILAERFGIAYYDNELIALAAEHSGYDRALFENAEKDASNSLLFSLSLYNTAMGGSYTMPLGDKVFLIQSEIIRRVAPKGPALSSGVCGDYVLRSHPNCVRVFVRAPLAWRVQRAVREYGLPIGSAREDIQRIDKRRAVYYAHFTGEKWGASSNYELTVDSSCVGVAATAEVVGAMILEKQVQLS